MCSLGFFFSDFPGFYSKKHEDIMLPSSMVGYVVATFYLVNSIGTCAPIFAYLMHTSR